MIQVIGIFLKLNKLVLVKNLLGCGRRLAVSPEWLGLETGHSEKIYTSII